METKPPLPPFTLETAQTKVQLAEDAWNSCDPERVALAYTEDSEWRNRSEFLNGRTAIEAFLKHKWEKELDYRLKKELWCFMDNRIAVRFEYEWHDNSGLWYRSYGNENWEFADNGLMMRRFACINDLPIQESERKFRTVMGNGDLYSKVQDKSLKVIQKVDSTYSNSTEIPYTRDYERDDCIALSTLKLI